MGMGGCSIFSLLASILGPSPLLFLLHFFLFYFLVFFWIYSPLEPTISSIGLGELLPALKVRKSFFLPQVGPLLLASPSPILKPCLRFTFCNLH